MGRSLNSFLAMSLSLEDRIIELVAEVTRLDASKITPDSRFIEDLGANSLDVVELTCLAEGEFDIRIPESRLASIHTVRDVFLVFHELKQG